MPVKFEKKIIFNFFYHRGLLKDSFILQKPKMFSFKRKTGKKFSIKQSIKKKITTFFSRPLKSFSRVFIQQLSGKYKIPLFIDLTNFSFSLIRNKLRRHILLYGDFYLNFFSKKVEHKKIDSIEKFREILLLDYFYHNSLFFVFSSRNLNFLPSKLVGFDFFLLARFLLVAEKNEKRLFLFENKLVLLQILFI